MVWYHGTQHKDNQLIALHKKGMNDREIAEKLGVSNDVVKYHRIRLGLKAHDRRRRRFTDQQLIELYELGLNDREIAEKIGAGTNTVAYYRRSLGLEAHGRALVSFKR